MAQENSDSQISRNKDLPSSSRTPNSTLSAGVSAPTSSAKSTMSRRKVKGLTHTGRQVSEDPDLDNLLSILSPEEVEELQMDLMKVPDLKPEDGKIIVQGENQAAQAPVSNNVGDAKLDRKSGGDPKGRLSQRENSFEVCELSAWLVLLFVFLQILKQVMTLVVYYFIFTVVKGDLKSDKKKKIKHVCLYMTGRLQYYVTSMLPVEF